MCGIWALLTKETISKVDQSLAKNLDQSFDKSEDQSLDKNEDFFDEMNDHLDNLSDFIDDLKNIPYLSFQKIKSRGPDKSTFIELPNLMLGFHRLSIMDLINGDQPFKHSFSNNKIVYTLCNGEIYNYKELIQKYDLKPESGSDCEIIPLLYEKIGFDQLCLELLGEYAFIIIDYDPESGLYDTFVCRDRFGVRPLFYYKNNNSISFCSELKGIYRSKKDKADEAVVAEAAVAEAVVAEAVVNQFRAGCYMKIDNKLNITEYKPYYTISNPEIKHYNLDTIKYNIRTLLTEAVKCRLLSDRPLGCLLSGGLDSSLVASIAARILKERGLPKLKTFSVGMPGSTDYYYALQVAKHIDSDHTHFELEQDKWLDLLPKIVEIIESYDITTVRASTGNYLVPKLIKDNTDIKVLLIGDGSDELTSGYMYFHNAPNAQESHLENIRLLEDINYFDALRADRGIAANGLEARVPFLDHRFVDYYLSIDPELRVPKEVVLTDGTKTVLEKWLLREAFKEGDYLPEEVRLRRKEAFSDGVSSKENSWFSIIKAHTDKLYTDEQLENNIYSYNRPVSKEALYYRTIFEDLYPNSSQVIPYFWLPKWSGNIQEPSARVLSVYT